MLDAKQHIQTEYSFSYDVATVTQKSEKKVASSTSFRRLK
jgi:hypothetical protein